MFLNYFLQQIKPMSRADTYPSWHGNVTCNTTLATQ